MYHTKSTDKELVATKSLHRVYVDLRLRGPIARIENLDWQARLALGAQGLNDSRTRVGGFS